MGYKKATKVLPQHLLRAVQEYVDGEYLYIPRKEENRKHWGETAPQPCLPCCQKQRDSCPAQGGLVCSATGGTVFSFRKSGLQNSCGLKLRLTEPH